MYFVFFFKQKTAYEMRISDWSSDVCSSDLIERFEATGGEGIAREVLEDILAEKGFDNVQLVAGNVFDTIPGFLENNPAQKIALQIGRASCRERVCQVV